MVSFASEFIPCSMVPWSSSSCIFLFDFEGYLSDDEEGFEYMYTRLLTSRHERVNKRRNMTTIAVNIYGEIWKEYESIVIFHPKGVGDFSEDFDGEMGIGSPG